jgi:uncharacterized oligopeptide transporter (OPT) family protein
MVLLYDILGRMSLQSALIGFLLSRMLPTQLSVQEIVVVQTTAVATGTVRDRMDSSKLTN